MAHKPSTLGKPLSLLSRTVRHSSQIGGEPTPNPTPPNLEDIFAPSKPPASGPARDRSLPPSRPSLRFSAREATISPPQEGEDIFTPRTQQVAPTNPNPSALPDFTLLEPNFLAIPRKPCFTQILWEFISCAQFLFTLPLTTREDMETTIQELTECESFLHAYHLQPREDQERRMVVDDEALDLYHAHYSAITTEKMHQHPSAPPSSNLENILPALQTLLAESRNTKA